jgi:hypothetical protein
MSMNPRIRAGVIAGLAAGVWIAAAQTNVEHVNSVKLMVAVDRSSPCHLSLSASIEASGMGTVWYRFLGPDGVTFDFGAEGTKELQFGPSFGAGMGAKMAHDIRGEFKVQAAMVGANGKPGPITVSNIVPAAYTCGGGTAIATQVMGAGAPAEPQAAQPSGKVTAVRLRLVPERYAGPCPGHVQLVGEITTDGPGTVWYHFLAGAVSHSPEGTVKFDSAGTKTVTIQGAFNVAPQVPHASMLAVMTDSDGKHGPQNVTSGPVDYNITCAAK